MEGESSILPLARIGNFGLRRMALVLPPLLMQRTIALANGAADFENLECAYAFSHVDKERKDENAHVSSDTYWPVRRTVVYHKYSLVKGRKQEIWIVIGSKSGSEDLRKQILDYEAHNIGGKSDPSPFELHLLI